jgi:drug/metabolite transporter (DMT)-like permease
VLGPALALGSSLGYGVSDFLGGTASRRIGTLPFISCSQLIGVALAIGWVVLSRDPVPSLATLAAGAGAGIAMTVALAAFFEGMVIGRMSVVAPVSAIGVVVPIAAGIAGGEQLTAAEAVGIVAAIGGVVVAARVPGEQHTASRESGVGLALIAALGAGAFLWLMAPASRQGAAWAVLSSRAVPALVLTVVLYARRSSLRETLTRRNAPLTLTASLLGFAAAALYSLATRHGQLSIISVLGSLYPVVTVMLAYVLLGERLHRAQQFGIVGVLAGIVLLST